MYHMDAISTQRGDAWLVYAGVADRRKGVRLFLRYRSNGRWQDERMLPFGRGSVNRPRLALRGEKEVVLAADVYQEGKYDIAWTMLSGSEAGRWRRITHGNGWNLFPSVVADKDGCVWLSWLHQTPVRRDDVMGLSHEARVARLVGRDWCVVRDGRSDTVADLNLGLLPIQRYFGYDGLRRYPRLLATTDGAIWLLWEQQKDEREVWDNLANGFLCARRRETGKWSRTRTLMQAGCCFAFDTRRVYPPYRIPIAVKGPHLKSGNDFTVRPVDLNKGETYDERPKRLWLGWKPQSLPVGGADRSRVRIKDRHLGGMKLFWGDLHCHSAFSPDAEGEPDELYHFARDLAELDFVCIADNDFYPNKALLDSEVHFTAELAGQLSEKGRFLALSGYEWTFHRPDAGRSFNHRIVVFPRNGRRIARRNEPAGKSERAFTKYLESAGYLSFAHHAYWKLLGARGEHGVEVTAAWGTYILDAPTVFETLNAGKRFSFLGNSDSHRFMPGLSGGLTGVYATELTREVVLRAIRKGRCFATTGNRTVTAFWVNDRFMGGEALCSSAPNLRWEVRPHGILEKVTIIRDGEPVRTASTRKGEWADTTVSPGRHWYVLQVKEQGVHKRYPHNVASAWGKYAWTSPTWVRV